MTHRMLVMLALVVIAPMLRSQEKPRTRLGVLAGGSVVYGSGNPWVSTRINRFNFSSMDTAVMMSGMDNLGHVGLGVSRALANTAIVLRGDLLLNVNRGEPPRFTPYPSWMNTRQALREYTLLASGGLQWDALPWHRFSPYMLTGAGFRRSWIGWSSDSSGTTPDRTFSETAPFVSIGGGLRLRLGRREYFTEWHWYGIPHDNAGSRFVPISVGVRL